MHLLPTAGPPRATEGYACYWSFAAERQRVYYRRLAECRPPLTEDPVIAVNRFTNPYRASDRVSQYLINCVQYNQEWDWLDTFVRTLVFKVFNRIETWEQIVYQLGEPNWESLKDGSVHHALTSVSQSRPLYSAAYIMPPPRSIPGPKYIRHLELVRQMVAEDAPARILAARTMKSAFQVLRAYDSIGDFLAYQFITDLNYSAHLDFSETEFVVPGPGALRGLQKCFVDTGGRSAAEMLQWTYQRQHIEFGERGLDWQGLWGRPLQLIDIQNLYCEVDKYTRVSHPELGGENSRSRIKQRYRPATTSLTAWFPPKWGLNDLIASREPSAWIRQLAVTSSKAFPPNPEAPAASLLEPQLPGI